MGKMPKGVYKRKPRTQEHNAAISEGLKNSGAIKAKADAQRGVPLSPEHSYAISKALQGIPKPPRTAEHSAAISEANKESEAAKANAEAMRGGHDIVGHHIAYDFGRPKALTVKITRKFHSQIHNPKGISVSQYGYNLID